MPNARDAHPDTRPHRILALGTTGSGKTTQLLTLPRPLFAYLFDPNALLSLQGHDIEYEEHLTTALPMAVKSLAKEKAGASDKSLLRGSDVYHLWEQSFEKRLREGYFEPFKTIALDSITTFLDLIMDRVLTINGRPGQWPQQDDYGPQMVAFTNVVRTLTGMGKIVYCTGHLMTQEDELTKRIFRQPIMTGRLREKIPLLFSDVLVFEAKTDIKGKVNYNIQTTPDSMTPTIRTAFKGVGSRVDVTLDFAKPLETQGIGGLILAERQRFQPEV